MRRAVLLRSVIRVMRTDTVVHDAAYMWTRHRWAMPFGALVLAAAVLLAPVVGIEDWPTRVVIGLAVASVAVLAATDYRVVAQTGDGIVLLRASKIRQVATGFVETLPPDAQLVQVGGTILAADWQVGDRRYTVARSSEQAMNRMAAAGSANS